MKLTLKAALLIALFTSSTIVMANDDLAKRYPVKSAKVSYEIKGSGSGLGLVDINILGKKTLLMDNYGINELTEENKIEELTQSGTTTTNKHHTITYLNGAVIYQVDFDKKRITRSKNDSLVLGKAMSAEKGSIAAFGKDMLVKMGGKQTGSDDILGYTCDIWELMGVKQCMYNDIPLQVVTDIMGMKIVEQATSAEFDIKLTDKDFSLPDYPVFQVDMQRLMDGKALVKLDKSKLEAMDRLTNLEAAKESDQLLGLAEKMADAAKKAGMKSGQLPTEAQGEAMVNNMKQAMFPMVKQQILKEEAGARFMAKCLDKADSLKDANQCNQEALEKYPSEDDDTDDLEEWNPIIKKDILGEINNFLTSIDCIKAAKDMSELEQCGFGE